jgi:hypothetical protein
LFQKQENATLTRNTKKNRRFIMEKKVIITAILIAMLSVAFSMSGDGENVPVVQKKEAVNVLNQDTNNKVNLEESESLIVRETVEDQFGFDTGMTKSEFDAFKAQYLRRAEELGIPKSPGYVTSESYFDHKLNINAVEELKKLGLFVTQNPRNENETFGFSITNSDIILIGTVNSVEYFHKTKEEEWKVSPGSALSRYFVKVDKILKGEEFYKTVPSKVSYLSSIGKFLTISSDYQLKIGQKYILFFQKPKSPLKNFKNDLSKIKMASLRIVDDRIYIEYFNEEFKSLEEILSTIDNFNRINDTSDFYKRNYIIKEQKNEK